MSAAPPTQPDSYASVMMERNFLKRALADLNFFNNAHDGVVFTDAENKVVYANPYFMTMMGISDPAEILNKPLPSYVWGGKPEQAELLFKDVRDNGFVRERELSLHNKKYEPVFAMCSSVASRDGQGNFVGTEIMLCNVTGKRRVEAELRDRTQKLERVTQYTQTTLTILREMLERGDSNRAMLDMVKRLQNEVERGVPQTQPGA